MLLSYDPEGDVLEVVFDENLHRADQTAYQLRDGVVLFVAADTQKPVQLTLVNYKGLMRFPVVYFDGWQTIGASDKKTLLPLLKSSPITTFLKLDPQTGYGHLCSPGMPELLTAS